MAYHEIHFICVFLPHPHNQSVFYAFFTNTLVLYLFIFNAPFVPVLQVVHLNYTLYASMNQILK